MMEYCRKRQGLTLLNRKGNWENTCCGYRYSNNDRKEKPTGFPHIREEKLLEAENSNKNNLIGRMSCVRYFQN